MQTFYRYKQAIFWAMLAASVLLAGWRGALVYLAGLYLGCFWQEPPTIADKWEVVRGQIEKMRRHIIETRKSDVQLYRVYHAEACETLVDLIETLPPAEFIAMEDRE